MYLRSLSVALLLLTEACGMGDAPDHRGCEADARATERAINSTALSVDKVDVFLDIAHERIAQGQDPLPSFIGCLTVADEAATFANDPVVSAELRKRGMSAAEYVVIAWTIVTAYYPQDFADSPGTDRQMLARNVQVLKLRSSELHRLFQSK